MASASEIGPRPRWVFTVMGSLAGNALAVLCQEDAKASCRMRDEGGPFGAAVQEEAPNCHELLRPKSVVVNVMVKRRGETASSMDERDECK